MADAKLVASNVCKIYNAGKKNAFKAIDNVNVEVCENEFVCMVGPSGCGKSTLLRMFAGLDFPTSGEITIDGEKIIGPGANRGMVFQTYTLFPWMTVEDNIKFGPKLKKMTKQEQQEITDKYLTAIGLEKFRNSRHPSVTHRTSGVPQRFQQQNASPVRERRKGRARKRDMRIMCDPPETEWHQPSAVRAVAQRGKRRTGAAESFMIRRKPIPSPNLSIEKFRPETLQGLTCSPIPP